MGCFWVAAIYRWPIFSHPLGFPMGQNAPETPFRQWAIRKFTIYTDYPNFDD
jgi:hypothetical protein